MTSDSKNDRLLFTALNDVVRPRGTKNPEELKQRQEKIPDRKGLLAEALLLSDQIVIDIGGPNLELSVLLDFFGYKRLCELLEEDVINFSYCPGTFAYISQANKRALNLSANPGIHRMTGVEPAWSDPFESATLALREQTDLPRASRRSLARLVTNNTKVLPAERMFDEAIRLANADKASQLGKDLGFTDAHDPEKIDFEETDKRKYLSLASHNLSYLNMSLSECSDLVAEELAYRVLENRVTVNPIFSSKVKITNNILEFEDIPNIRSLVASEHLSLEQILELRRSKNLQNFRNWLGTIPSSSSATEVLKAYKAEVENKLSSKPFYKVLKVGTFSGVGAILGSVGGPLGTVVGSIATGLVTGFTDTFFIDKLVDGWNPKIFIEKGVKPRLDK